MRTAFARIAFLFIATAAVAATLAVLLGHRTQRRTQRAVSGLYTAAEIRRTPDIELAVNVLGYGRTREILIDISRRHAFIVYDGAYRFAYVRENAWSRVDSDGVTRFSDHVLLFYMKPNEMVHRTYYDVNELRRFLSVEMLPNGVLGRYRLITDEGDVRDDVHEFFIEWHVGQHPREAKYPSQ